MAYTDTAAGRVKNPYAGENAYGFDGVSAREQGIANGIGHVGTVERQSDRIRTNEGVSAAPRRKRSVSRTPDMSRPRARAKAPSVEIGMGSTAVAAAKPDKRQVREVLETKRTPLPVGMILTAVVCTILFLFMINTFVMINESTIELSSMRVELGSLISEERDLALKLEKKNDLRKIEEYATAVLRMVKNDQLPKKYVAIGSEDKIEPAPEEVSNDGLFGGAFDALRDTFGEIMEYIN